MNRNIKNNNFGTAFFGTSRIAVYVLDELKKANIVPDIVVTAPDRPAGRGLELKSPLVKMWADEHDIPVIQPASLMKDNAELQVLLNTDWKVFLVADYGFIIPKRILDLPFSGTLNVHPSLLPRFRGPSPIISQILDDEREVGVSIMLMDEELDHGPVIAQASVTPETWPLKASILGEILAREGGRLLAEILPTWIDESSMSSDQYEMNDGSVFVESRTQTLVPSPQNHDRATYTKKFEKSDGEIQLTDDPYVNYLKYCAFEEWPGTFFFVDGKRFKITEATFEHNNFIVKRVIPEGKKEMDYSDLLKSSR